MSPWSTGYIGIRSDTQELVPYRSTGWKYKQPIPYGDGTGGGSYAHNTDFAQPGFDDSSWAVGQAPFGGQSGGLIEPSSNTYWQIQSGIKLRRTVNIRVSRNLLVEVNVDNLAYVYWNGEQVLYFDNSFNPPSKSSAVIPANKVNQGNNTLAVMAWEETYEYTRDGGFIDVELREA